MYKQVRGEDLALGDEVTVWRMPDGSSGQGGILTSTISGTVTVTAPGDRIFEFDLRDVHHFSVDRPGDPKECLNYGHDGSECEGDVEYWHSGGINGRHFPRCEKHGLARLNNRSELERYADSDCAPPRFDPADAGERWSDDY